MNNEPSDATKPVAWGHPAILLATCFWIGRLRPAPGTWGSAAALPFIAALSLAEVPFFIEVQLWLTLCCIGVPICTIASKQLGGQKDP
ncbi:MAG: phosphatidylglycerophosphatase A, partial [Planctomycetota bacterium]|nr:phosphatidylglycerophosphatase A [Planctomycetota bacterium]